VALRARYLADKSALARFDHDAVAERLTSLLDEGLVATCVIVDLEVLFSARNLQHYEDVLEERRALQMAPITPAVLDRSVDIQHTLARRGHHRLAIPDLIIAACAEASGLAVLHYDTDFDRIHAATGIEHEWVVPRCSLD
jgi:predicted nucleic acid-binding protein